MKYLVNYYEDIYSCVCEIEIECEENKIKDFVDKYYEENLKHLDISGANWREINK